jgi:prepilin-type N-terminal cleavage/methylation domain-containing protein/prepilin-type processing-associated H-X9-DG protein
MNSNRSASFRRGYTLIEMLIVIAIVGILIGLTLAAVQRSRAASVRLSCQNQLRQLGLAFHGHVDSHQALPPGHRTLNHPDRLPATGWTLSLLPYLEQNSLYDAALIAFREIPYPYLNPPHVPLNTVVKSFLCPADDRIAGQGAGEGKGVAFTSYLGVSGITGQDRQGVLFGDSKIRMGDILDGTSTTLLLGERPPDGDFRFGWWYAVSSALSMNNNFSLHMGVLVPNPGNNYAPFDQIPSCAKRREPFEFSQSDFADPCGMFHFWSPHSGGANFLIADGSVHFFAYASKSVIPSLATRAKGEVTGIP